ncbi:endonuclease domain-containing protein [Streptomyces natalensis]|uniref:Recombination endonuclease VII n=1 Tax=Streptomyces natalensis ATCC 27448 TaxID=1240678 RepID=A0A0D7CFX5_9ACTN|nr:endonuclease domain-containing protein [Streptomyces natalensis]KIZ14946.1 hypothetical protein SNA_29925 [Streptomyces natalensis ATCC 27448]
MMEQKVAARILAQTVQDCPIPLAPERFKKKRFTEHDVVFFAHVPVRAYKHANRWRFHDADVHRAGQAVAALPWDPDDLVDPRINRTELEPQVHVRRDWRSEIQEAIQSAADAERKANSCPCATAHHRQEESDWGIPCGLSPQALRKWQGAYSIACTLPIPTLVWAKDTWLIPRTLADILDRREEQENNLLAADRPCSGCGTPSPDNSWRTSTTNGWKVLCPTCAAATLLRYRDQLRGVAYSRFREPGPQAGDYLCAVCETPRPATDWDHCHDHDLIRGPLCGSCNTMEGQGKEFLTRTSALHHLLRCSTCRTQRTLPSHHRLAALRRHLHREWGARGCDWPLHMCVNLNEHDEDGYDGTVRCPGQKPRRSHRVHLTAGEADRILALAVETGLTETP